MILEGFWRLPFIETMELVDDVTHFEWVLLESEFCNDNFDGIKMVLGTSIVPRLAN